MERIVMTIRIYFKILVLQEEELERQKQKEGYLTLRKNREQNTENDEEMTNKYMLNICFLHKPRTTFEVQHNTDNMCE